MVLDDVRLHSEIASASGHPEDGVARSEHRRLGALQRLHRMSAAEPISSQRRSSLVSEARRYLGRNPTGWARVWCGRFLRMVVPSDPGPAFNVARNWKNYGSLAPGPVAGAIGVMPHHVGIVLGKCAGGGVLLRSGNHNRAVGDGCYSAARFIAFRISRT